MVVLYVLFLLFYCLLCGLKGAFFVIVSSNLKWGAHFADNMLEQWVHCVKMTYRALLKQNDRVLTLIVRMIP